MRKQLQIFMDIADEIAFSDRLRSSFDDVYFIENDDWTSRSDRPQSISDCHSSIAFICFRPPEQLTSGGLPSANRENAYTGPVIQFIKSRLTSGEMRSGRVAAVCNSQDEETRAVISQMWTCLKCVGKKGVTRPDGRRDMKYFVGNSVEKRVESSELRLRDRSVLIYYDLPC